MATVKGKVKGRRNVNETNIGKFRTNVQKLLKSIETGYRTRGSIGIFCEEDILHDCIRRTFTRTRAQELRVWTMIRLNRHYGKEYVNADY